MRNSGGASSCAVSAGALVLKALDAELRLSHAASAQQAAKRRYTEDQSMICWREERRGSIKKGKLKSALREARLESANKGYGERPGARRAYEVCIRGLVALSKIKGRPIENVSNPRMRQAGSTSTC